MISVGLFRRWSALLPVIFFYYVGGLVSQELALYPLQGSITASSVHQSAVADRAIDGDLNSHWTSDTPLPDKYLSQPHHNVLLGASLVTPSAVSMTAATDGNLQSATMPIPVINGSAKVSYQFPKQMSLVTLGIRLGGIKQAVAIRLFLADGGTHELSYPLASNYQHLRFSPEISPIVGFELTSKAGFSIYELGMTQRPFIEYLTLDLNGGHWVKEIHTKHWAGAGNAEKTSLYLGMNPDSLTWVADLNPESLDLTKTVLGKAVWARFIRIAHTVRPENFRKVSVFEIAAFGEKHPEPLPETEVVWDPDAGIYAPLSAGGQVVASSSVSNPLHGPKAIIDQNFATSWVSDNPLPDRYLSNADQNVLLGKPGTASNGASMVNATDGVLGNFTPMVYPVSGNVATYRLELPPTNIRRLTLRIASGLTAPLTIRFSDGAGNLTDRAHSAGSNASIRHVVEMDSVTAIMLEESEAPFAIQEIGAYSKPLSEYITVDLGGVKPVSWIRTRHWNGTNNSLGARLLAGRTLEDLQLIETLDPDRLDPQLIQLPEPLEARYIRLVHDLVDENFKKASVQEITVFDQHGAFGPPPSPRPQRRSFSELFGLNTVWAWGTNKIPNLQGPDEGAQKFNRVASQARNYHNIHWDTTDPDLIPSYDPDNMNVHMQWTLWHREYGDWKNKGFTVDATYTFDRFPETAWDTPFESAYHLGRAFASVYGPGNLNLVRAVEVGNEPWGYSDTTYVKILEGMAKGMKEADPALIVLPAALQATGLESGNLVGGKNYMGAKLSEAAAKYLDGLNLHLYSYTRNSSGARIAVHPEHPESSMQALFAAIRFRDKNMPGKEVHVTEWGWDASSANEQAVNTEAVSEVSQAAYALRGLFWLSRMGVDRAHWYFYANVEVAPGKTPLNYDRSGLTESRLFNFREKRAFKALESMQKRMGDLFFDEVIQEDEQAYIYALRNAQGEQSHLIAWRPVAGEDSLAVQVPVSISGTISEAWYLSGLDTEGEAVQIQERRGQWMLPLSSIPLLIRLEEEEPFDFNWLNLQGDVVDDEVELTLRVRKPLEEGVTVQLWEGAERHARPVHWVQTDALVWKTVIRKMPPGRYEFRANAGPGLASNEVSASVQPWFSLHPNPASDRTVLRLSHPLAEESTVSIIAPDGQVYGEFSLPAFSQELELSLPHLKEGFYLVKLVNGTYYGNTKLLKR